MGKGCSSGCPSSHCEIMFPLCNVQECKERLLTSKRETAAPEIEAWYENFCTEERCVCKCVCVIPSEPRNIDF